MPETTVNMFDWWLATRRQNARRTINPLQFSMDCEIDINHTLKIFSESVFNDEINLLKQKFVTYCPRCSHRIKTQYDFFDTGTVYRCGNCDMSVKDLDLLDESTETLFELIKEPKKINKEGSEVPTGVPRGKLVAFGSLR